MREGPVVRAQNHSEAQVDDADSCVAAGWAAASHCWQTSARKPLPGGEVSSSSSLPRSP